MDHIEIKNFVSKNMKTIYAYAINRLSDPVEAEELAGEIIAEILSSADNLRDKRAIYGFVWAIANNIYKKFLSRKKRNIYVEINDTVESEKKDICDLILQEEEIKSLRRELTLLSNEYRICTVEYYFQNMGCKEIAQKHNFSLEMVKYYLFKSRKILKEGMAMEREFGEKSFNPSVFEFCVIFERLFNQNYVKLFNRKISGNILISAYYTPVAVQELALELGIPTVYIEDELDLLERHGLIRKTNKNKYQTNIVIFTEEYADQVIEKTRNTLQKGVHEIHNSLIQRMDLVRQVDFYGNHFTENQLLWLCTILLLFRCKCGQTVLPYQELIPGCRGAVFGYDYQGALHERFLCDYAGFSEISEELYSTYINLHVLSPMKYECSHENRMRLIKEAREGKADVPVLSREAKRELFDILSLEIEMMRDLYIEIANTAETLLMEHSPARLANRAKDYVHLELNSGFFGMVPDMMVHERLLSLSENIHVGMYLNIDRQGVIDFHTGLG